MRVLPLIYGIICHTLKHSLLLCLSCYLAFLSPTVSNIDASLVPLNVSFPTMWNFHNLFNILHCLLVIVGTGTAKKREGVITKGTTTGPGFRIVHGKSNYLCLVNLITAQMIQLFRGHFWRMGRVLGHGLSTYIVSVYHRNKDTEKVLL